MLQTPMSWFIVGLAPPTPLQLPTAPSQSVLIRQLLSAGTAGRHGPAGRTSTAQGKSSESSLFVGNFRPRTCRKVPNAHENEDPNWHENRTTAPPASPARAQSTLRACRGATPAALAGRPPENVDGWPAKHPRARRILRDRQTRSFAARRMHGGRRAVDTITARTEAEQRIDEGARARASSASTRRRSSWSSSEQCEAAHAERKRGC